MLNKDGKERVKVFFDMEFTGLVQNTTLVSIGLVSEDGKTFYAETNDFNEKMTDEWFKKNIIPKLKFRNKHTEFKCEENKVEMKGSCKEIAQFLQIWLSDDVEMYSDCLAYDWVLFCELFGGARSIPENIYYIPFDICTSFLELGIDPDINREEFGKEYCNKDIFKPENKHNSLFDAYMIKACYDKMAHIKYEEMSDLAYR